jgi:predicted GNAT family acetyltransferase
MIVKTYENARIFLNEHETDLLKQEAVSQLIIYNAYQNLYVSINEKCIFGAILEDNGTPYLLFCNVEPYHLVINIAVHNKDLIQLSVIALANYIVESHISLTGIIAKNEVCLGFIAQYTKSVNCNFVEKQGMDIMEIRQINDVKPIEGIHRPAMECEAKTIVDWMIQYQIEAEASEMDYEAALKKVISLIENKQIYIYENTEQEMVSMAATTRKLVHGMGISYVFTPEEFRGKGYAAANIYYLSKQLLESGFEFCTLFVDKKNPIASRTYEKIGYLILDENYEYTILPNE